MSDLALRDLHKKLAIIIASLSPDWPLNKIHQSSINLGQCVFSKSAGLANLCPNFKPYILEVDLTKTSALTPWWMVDLNFEIGLQIIKLDRTKLACLGLWLYGNKTLSWGCLSLEQKGFMFVQFIFLLGNKSRKQ